jgi:hypothetical protein
LGLLEEGIADGDVSPDYLSCCWFPRDMPFRKKRRNQNQ